MEFTKKIKVLIGGSPNLNVVVFVLMLHTATQLSEKLYQAFLGFPRPETKKIINLM